MLHWILLGKNCILADLALHPGCAATWIPSVPAPNLPVRANQSFGRPAPLAKIFRFSADPNR
jgi:hypothetical protein